MSAVARKITNALFDKPGVKAALNLKKNQAQAVAPAAPAAPAAAAVAESVQKRARSRSGARRSGGMKLLMSPARATADNNQDGQTTLGVKGTL